MAETVSAALRSWSVRWPAYAPMDVTPPELLPTALTRHVPAWAEAAATPADVTDRGRRRDTALVPYELDARVWPLHPQGRIGRTGRNLGRWGENAAADPIVVAGTGQDRRFCSSPATTSTWRPASGGMVDRGETAPAALVRALPEETSVDLAGHRPGILAQAIVDDWRASGHAWVASASALYLLPAAVTATAADDALDAQWRPFGPLGQRDTEITAAGRILYAAHRPLL
ncbi:NUDIX domain-containing protein [Streptomyces sp. NPDC096033]|uniref:NUDIX domain-containing protein n=1 Tax=Streptomyces sp. NPDC096033 TaxID=3366071 RepID=UPI00382DB4F7